MIEKILIKKFKNLENIEINLNDTNIISVLGQNNIGKSNILEAINFFETEKILNLRETEREEEVIFFFKIDEKTSKQFKNNFIDEFVKVARDEDKEYKIVSLSLEENPNDENIELDLKKIEKKFLSNAKEFWKNSLSFSAKVSKSSNLENPYAFSLDEKFEKYETFWEMFKGMYPTIILLNKENNISEFAFKNEFSIDDNTFNQLLFHIFDIDMINKFGAFFTFNEAYKRTLLKDLNEKATHFLFGDWKEEKYEFTLSQINDQEKKFSLLIIKPSDSDEEISFPSEISDGLKFHINIKLKLGSGFFNYLFLIDEPNNFLHPTSQYLLKYYFKKITFENYSKIIFTTHSEHIIDFNFSILYKQENNWIQEYPKNIRDLNNIQLKVLKNNLIAYNPVFDHFQKNDKYLEILSYANNERFKNAISELRYKLEERVDDLFNVLNIPIQDNQPLSTKIKSLLEHFNKKEEYYNNLNLKFDQLGNFSKTIFSRLDNMLHIGNYFSSAHPKRKKDTSKIVDKDIKDLFPAFFSAYSFGIEFISFLIDEIGKK